MPPLPVPKSSPQLPQTIFSGDQFGAQQGRALQGLGNDITQFGGVLQERQTQREISTLNAEITKAQAELTVAWRKTLAEADPNDPEVASRFMREQVQSRLSKIGDSASTREAKMHFSRLSTGLSANFLVSTDAGQANLAEVKAVSDFENSLNNITDAVRADPLSFDTTLPVIELTLDGFQRSGGLTAETRIKLTNDAKRSAARAAAYGLIEQSPETAREIVESGKYSEYITAEDKRQLVGFADTAITAREAARRKAVEEAASIATTEYLGAAINTDGTVNTAELPNLLAQIVDDPRLATGPGADQQRVIFNMIRGLAENENRPLRTDPATFQDLYGRSVLPPGDPRRATEEEIFNAVGRGRLTNADANALLDRRKGENTNEGRVRNQLQETAFTAAARYIAGNADLGLADPEGALQYAAFQGWALGEIQRLENTGTPIHEIYAPDGPIYSAMSQFKKTPNEVMNTLITELRRGREEERVQPEIQPFETTFKGRPVTELSPAELDEFLKERKRASSSLRE